MADTDFVVVRTFLNKMEAELARSVLEAADIDSMVRADDCHGVEPGLWMGGVPVFVAAADEARALEVLDSSVGAEVDVEDAAGE